MTGLMTIPTMATAVKLFQVLWTADMAKRKRAYLARGGTIEYRLVPLSARSPS